MNSLHLQPALSGGKGPASETVGNIGAVASSAAKTVVEVVVVNRAAVVHARSSKVVSLRTSASSTSSLSKSLLKTVTVLSTGSAVTNHLEDRVPGAGVDASARARAVVRLHETRVADTVVGGGSADTALGLLEDNGEHEAGADLGFSGDLVDGLLDVVDFVLGVVGAPAVPVARVAEDVEVSVPELVEGSPLAEGRPVGSVAGVEAVGVGDGALLDGSGGSGWESGSGAGESESGEVELHFGGLDWIGHLRSEAWWWIEVNVVGKSD